ncbi:MAG: hypothetical protein HY769_04870 [Candidatus Stahlbacteria bacterium]|nr:hypothetical protein [Candidatus Stahlbacteria bacterium]
MERKGIRAERLQLEWCSAAEASRWGTIMQSAEERRKTITKEEIEKTKRLLIEEDEKKVLPPHRDPKESGKMPKLK